MFCVVLIKRISDFLDLPNHKEILEKNLSQNYVALSPGTSFTISHNSKNYDLNVINTSPIDGVSLFNTDIEIEFLKPIDYKLSDKDALDMITNLINSQKIPIPEKLLDNSRREMKQAIKVNNSNNLCENEINTFVEWAITHPNESLEFRKIILNIS